MSAVLQGAQAGPVPVTRRILGRIRRQDRNTTPGQLRLMRLLLGLGLAVTFFVSSVAAYVLSDTTATIAERLEPINSEVTTLYRALAEADATAAAMYLAGSSQPGAGDQYDRNIADAAAGLVHLSAPATEDPVALRRVADIAAQLPVYTGLVEQAREQDRQHRGAGADTLRRASQLMQSAILQQARELQERQALRLEEAYSQARTAQFGVAAGVVGLGGLVWAQVFLFRRTRRVFNLGLVLASGAVVASVTWWTVVDVVTAGLFTSSQAHSMSVSGGLGPAQTLALQARSIEILHLVNPTPEKDETEFSSQQIVLEGSRSQGSGGALGAAMRYASDPEGRTRVRVAIDTANAYFDTPGAGRWPDGPRRALLPSDRMAKDTEFVRLNTALRSATDYESAGFRRDIVAAGQWLRGLPVGSAVLGGVALVGVVVGVQQRLEDYR